MEHQELPKLLEAPWTTVSRPCKTHAFLLPTRTFPCLYFATRLSLTLFHGCELRRCSRVEASSSHNIQSRDTTSSSCHVSVYTSAGPQTLRPRQSPAGKPGRAGQSWQRLRASEPRSPRSPVWPYPARTLSAPRVVHREFQHFKKSDMSKSSTVPQSTGFTRNQPLVSGFIGLMFSEGAET